MDTLKRVITETAWGPIAIGFVLVVIGWLVPFLTVMHIIESQFLPLFASYASSVLGLLLGVIGAARIVVKSRNADRKEATRKSYPWEQGRARK